MLISQQQIDEFITNGFTLIDGLLPEALFDTAARDLHEFKGYPRENSFLNIYQHPNVEAAAKAVLGCSAVHLLSGATLYTEPQTGTWSFDPEKEHVDVQYTLPDWLETPRRILVTVMFFIDDIPADRAPTVVRPGSHLEIAEYNGDSAYSDHPVYIKDLPDLDYADPVPLCGKKGQVALSSTALVHAGSRNVSDKPRKMLFGAYADNTQFPSFNAERLDRRLDWYQYMEAEFRPERKHMVASAIPFARATLAERAQLEAAAT